MTLQRQRLAARVFDQAMRFSAFLQAWPQRLTPAPFRLLQIGSAFWQSRALHAAAQLDLATVLGDRRMAAEALAGAVGVQADALARLLRFLAAMGVFEEVGPATYRNNKLSSALRTDRRDNVRAMVLMHNSPEMSRPWFEQLENGLRSGLPPFRLTHGADLYDHMDAHPAFEALFAEAMDRVEALTGDSFATSFDWRAFDRVIDVGGSNGSKSMTILKHHPHLKALVVDRAGTIAAAQTFWRAQPHSAALTERLSRTVFEAGDVFGALPVATGGREAYLMSAVLHGFDDSMAERALRNVAAAARPGEASIVLLEMVMPDHHADIGAASFDMQMFMGTPGRERTRAEWDTLFERSSVRLVETVHLPSFGKMMVLQPLPG